MNNDKRLYSPFRLSKISGLSYETVLNLYRSGYMRADALTEGGRPKFLYDTFITASRAAANKREELRAMSRPPTMAEKIDAICII